MSNRILIADDEKEIVELLRLYLENDGNEVLEAYDGLEAWEKVQSQPVDIAVIDIMMPGMDGFKLVRKIREKYNIPLIILSARGEDSDKILGLGLGADDYIAKPFNPLEVVARVQAQLRRFHTLNKLPGKQQEDKLEIGGLVLDKVSCTLYRDDLEIPLTSIEYKLLLLFMEHPGRVYTKSQIFEQVWGEYFEGDDNTLMVHISKLRDKLEDDPREPRYLKTIRGLGYRFEKRI